MQDTQSMDVLFIKGIDTKTNPIFVTDNFLVLNNAQTYNQRIVKTTGYLLIGDRDITNPTVNQYAFTYGDNLYKVQSGEISRYRPTFDKFDSLAPLESITTRHNIGCSNIAGVGSTPVLSCLYEDYFTYIVRDSTTLCYNIYVFNLSDRVLEFSMPWMQDTLGNTLVMLSIVGTPEGVVIYYIEDTLVSSSNVLEIKLNFSNFNFTSPVLLIEDLFYYRSTTRPFYVDAYFRSLVAHYSAGQIYIMYRTGTVDACGASVLIRSLSTITVTTLPPFFVTFDLDANLGNNNFGAFTVPYLDYIIFMFGTSFFVVNKTTLSQSGSFSYTDAPGYTDEPLMTFNVGLFPDATELVFLKFSPYVGITCPLINKFNYTTNEWTLYTNTGNSDWVDGGYDTVPGSCSLAGAMICFNQKAYFPVAVFSYIVADDGTSTPSSQRRCSVFLVDSDYNVVDTLYSYDVSLIYTTEDYGSLTDVLMSYIQTTANVKITSVTPLSEKIVYPIVTNQSIEQLDAAGDTESYKYINSVQLIEVDSSLKTSFYSQEFNNSCYVGNSRLVEISGNVVSEQNWFDFPQILPIPTITVPSTGYENYIYSAVYVWYNGKGEIVRSAPSIQKRMVLIDGPTAANVFFTPPPFFSKKQHAKIIFYRSTDDGTTLFQIAEKSTDYVTRGSTNNFIDASPDVTIISNPIIYTSGGVLSNFPFPTSNFFTQSNGRIWSISRVNPLVLYYSLPAQLAVGLSTNPLYLAQVPALGGDCNALADLDGKLIIFKQDYIYVITGSPGNATGSNSTLRQATNVHSPVGCSEPNSVVRTPVGIMFKSPKGIYLLDRSLSLSYIGAQVEVYNTLTITSSVLLLRENKVKFATLEGPVLTYDYFYMVWSVETDLFFDSMTTYDSSFVGIKVDGECYLSSATTYTRDGNNYNQNIQTPWVSGGTIQGYVELDSIQFLGSYDGQHVLRVSVFYNYEKIATQIIDIYPNDVLGIVNAYGLYDWGSISVFGGSVANTYLFRITPTRTDCMAVSLSFEDVFQNTVYETGESFTLSHMRVVGKLVNSLFPVPTLQISG